VGCCLRASTSEVVVSGEGVETLVTVGNVENEGLWEGKERKKERKLGIKKIFNLNGSDGLIVAETRTVVTRTLTTT